MRIIRQVAGWWRLSFIYSSLAGLGLQNMRFLTDICRTLWQWQLAGIPGQSPERLPGL
jgi:hypothetical protein